MKPLKTNQQVLTWLGVCRAADTVSIPKKLIYIFAAFFGFSVVFTSLSASVAFFVKFVQIDLEESLYALFQIASFSGLSYIILTAFIMRNKINGIFNRLSHIYDACKLYHTNNVKNIFYITFIRIFRWKWRLFSIYCKSEQQEWMGMENLLPDCYLWIFYQHIDDGHNVASAVANRNWTF